MEGVTVDDGLHAMLVDRLRAAGAGAEDAIACADAVARAARRRDHLAGMLPDRQAWATRVARRRYAALVRRDARQRFGRAPDHPAAADRPLRRPLTPGTHLDLRMRGLAERARSAAVAATAAARREPAPVLALVAVALMAVTGPTALVPLAPAVPGASERDPVHVAGSHREHAPAAQQRHRKPRRHREHHEVVPAPAAATTTAPAAEQPAPVTPAPPASSSPSPSPRPRPLDPVLSELPFPR